MEITWLVIGDVTDPDLSSIGLREYDPAGNIVKETNAETVSDQLLAMGLTPINDFDHEVRKFADGRYLALGQTELLSNAQGPPGDILGDTM